jgi:O-antigen/teichoic acid export membrane protein
MAVFSGGAYHNSLRGYLRSLLGMHLTLSVIIASLLGIAAAAAQFYWKSAGIPGALLGVTIAAPCILLFWLTRRSYYMEFTPARAAAGAGIYFVLVAGGILVAARLHHISAFIAYVLMATGALVTSLYLLWHLRKSLSPDTEPAPSSGEVWAKHWAYGRWAIATQLANWVPYYAYYPVITQFHGVAAAGSLRALMNLSLPMEQTCTALSILFLPMSARRYRHGGARAAASLTERITALFVGGALVYWFFILPFRTQVMDLLYKGKYLEVTWLIPWLALGITLWAASFGPAIILRSMEDPSAVFWARAAATVLSVVLGVPLTWKYGLLGVMISLISANAASFLVTRILLSRKVARDHAAASAQAA